MAKTVVDEDVKVAHKPLANKVKVGDVMAIVTYVKVSGVRNSGEDLSVVNLDQGVKGFEIHGKDIVESSYSADQFEEEVKVTKTKLAEILVSSHNRPFTVQFEKDDKSVRTLRGRLINPEPLLGRSKVEDLDITGDYRIRLVDHRTINFLIVDGIKYIVK